MHLVHQAQKLEHLRLLFRVNFFLGEIPRKVGAPVCLGTGAAAPQGHATLPARSDATTGHTPATAPEGQWEGPRPNQSRASRLGSLSESPLQGGQPAPAPPRTSSPKNWNSASQRKSCCCRCPRRRCRPMRQRIACRAVVRAPAPGGEGARGGEGVQVRYVGAWRYDVGTL